MPWSTDIARGLGDSEPNAAEQFALVGRSVSSQMHVHLQVAQVDAAGQAAPGSFDHHSCLEGPHLHSQADKNCDQCFDWEAEEEGKFEARKADEGEQNNEVHGIAKNREESKRNEGG